MKKHIIAITFIPIALMICCGCAPPTANVVRGLGSKSQYIFEAGDNYQPVYDKIYAQAKKCFEVSKFSTDMIVFGNLDDKSKIGTVEVVLYGILDADTYQVIDIYDIDDNNALVIGYYSLNQASKYGPVLKEWVLDNSAECEPKKK